LLCTFYDY